MEGGGGEDGPHEGSEGVIMTREESEGMRGRREHRTTKEVREIIGESADLHRDDLIGGVIKQSFLYDVIDDFLLNLSGDVRGKRNVTSMQTINGVDQGSPVG